VRRDQRCCAWPDGCMMNQGGRRAKCNAVGPRLDRRVRPAGGKQRARRTEAAQAKQCRSGAVLAEREEDGAVREDGSHIVQADAANGLRLTASAVSSEDRAGRNGQQ
jgi:hypothetical protein